ncbi:hypothetical protein AXA84_0217 [Candidatus Phytoplasma oryzae]|uniref:Ribosomal processing cysteine protease Prp n=1 Tax=Candidatus Phytoplasma oryzae TaxID=203274 RepID=A0A139JQY8_9MOLU|nr:ribosomal-processing cysteine protease Prp [Candidatus Phytoplasma oryzae]KXT29270.1 hypothetical protein AXA84_0217 [Candidatus Phytoplasma oryzae]RAM57854.1 hypothetical protein DH96_00815 [Candidatus Phytoplasma oryzae]
MIKYFFFKENDNIKVISVKGHACYSVKKNNDIICSSVSTAILMTLNSIELLGFKKNIYYELKKGYFFLKVLMFNLIIDKLLQNLEYTLKNLNKKYSKNLKNESKKTYFLIKKDIKGKDIC